MFNYNLQMWIYDGVLRLKWREFHGLQMKKYCNTFELKTVVKSAVWGELTLKKMSFMNPPEQKHRTSFMVQRLKLLQLTFIFSIVWLMKCWKIATNDVFNVLVLSNEQKLKIFSWLLYMLKKKSKSHLRKRKIVKWLKQIIYHQSSSVYWLIN